MGENIETLPVGSGTSIQQLSEANEKFKRSATDLAEMIWEITSGGSGLDSSISSTIVNIITGAAKTKTEALAFLYITIDHLGGRDATGNTSASLLSSPLLKEIYAAYGCSLEESYIGCKPVVVKNSKAYLVDAFCGEYYPMYTNGFFGNNINIAQELIYPDRFLNILFRAIKNCFEVDMRTIKNLSVAYSRLNNSSTQEQADAMYANNTQILAEKFETETELIVNLFAQADGERLRSILMEKLNLLISDDNRLLTSHDSFDAEEIVTLLREDIAHIPEEISKKISELVSVIKGQDSLTLDYENSGADKEILAALSALSDSSGTIYDAVLSVKELLSQNNTAKQEDDLLVSDPWDIYEGDKEDTLQLRKESLDGLMNSIVDAKREAAEQSSSILERLVYISQSIDDLKDATEPLKAIVPAQPAEISGMRAGHHLDEPDMPSSPYQAGDSLPLEEFDPFDLSEVDYNESLPEDNSSQMGDETEKVLPDNSFLLEKISEMLLPIVASIKTLAEEVSYIGKDVSAVSDRVVKIEQMLEAEIKATNDLLQIA